MPQTQVFFVNCVRKGSPKGKTILKRKAWRYVTSEKKQKNPTHWMHTFEAFLQKSERWGRYFAAFLCCLSAILHTWAVARAGDSLLVSVMLFTLFPKARSDTIFYHQKQNKNSTKLDRRNSLQSKLTWAVLGRWFCLINMAPFFS